MISYVKQNSIYIDYYENGNIKVKIWHRNNQIHRDDDKPAIIDYYENENIKSKVWYQNNRIHRENDKPATIEYYYNGEITRKIWQYYGQTHRDNDKPARIGYYHNRNIEYEEWYKNNQTHRDNDKPAYIGYYKNGNVKNEMWFRNGQRHRNNAKPAYIGYRENGSIFLQLYYKYGIEVTQEFCQQDFSKYPIEKIFQEPNIQKRMMLIQLVGWDNILMRLQGKTIERKDQYELFQVNNLFDIPCKILKMKDPATKVFYNVSVPPDCNNIQEALKFYYGGNKYEFVQEK